VSSQYGKHLRRPARRQKGRHVRTTPLAHDTPRARHPSRTTPLAHNTPTTPLARVQGSSASSRKHDPRTAGGAGAARGAGGQMAPRADQSQGRGADGPVTRDLSPLARAELGVGRREAQGCLPRAPPAALTPPAARTRAGQGAQRARGGAGRGGGGGCLRACHVGFPVEGKRHRRHLARQRLAQPHCAAVPRSGRRAARAVPRRRAARRGARRGGARGLVRRGGVGALPPEDRDRRGRPLLAPLER
jgi:hypothetical protein